MEDIELIEDDCSRQTFHERPSLLRCTELNVGVMPCLKSGRPCSRGRTCFRREYVHRVTCRFS